MLLSRHPHWMTREGVGTSSIFFVVQERELPSAFSFWRGDPRKKIFERGEFPWEDMIDDLPNPRYFGQQGTLPTRAASCRLIDEITATQEASPIFYDDDVEDRLVEDPRTGEKAIGVEVRGTYKTIGQPKILVPHFGHVIVRIAWCSSCPIRMNRERMGVTDIARCGPNNVGRGAWSYTPIFETPQAWSRYILAFWEVPL